VGEGFQLGDRLADVIVAQGRDEVEAADQRMQLLDTGRRLRLLHRVKEPL
jgi:hypothetical protein